MAKYTTEVRRICENLVGQYEDIQYTDVSDIIRKSLTMIFDFEYPIFDENYKDVLEEKIIRHYYTREIGLETYGLWKLKLETKLNEIMPYYNQLYNSELIKINPLRTYSIDKKHNDSGGDERNITENGTDNNVTNVTGSSNNENSRTGKDTRQFDKSKGETFQTEDTNSVERNNATNGTNNTVNDGKTDGNVNGTVGNTRTENLKNKYSDTPQGSISNLENDTYLTNARINDNNITDNGNSSSTSTQTDHSSSNVTISGTEKSTEKAVSRDKHVTTGQENNNEVYDYSRTDRGNTSNNSKTESNDTTNKSTVDTITTTRAYIENIVGNSSGASESKLLMEFRNTFLNIDMMVINELEVLFMQIW